MATAPGPLYKWPWEDWGVGKYALYAPFVAGAVLGRELVSSTDQSWSLHMTCIIALRYVVAQFFTTLSRIPGVVEKRQIQDKSVEFKQVDREAHWDDYIILQALVMTGVHLLLPGFNRFAAWDRTGLWIMLFLHCGPTEFVYYWFHRALHNHELYRKYHSHHHASFVTEPTTGTVHPFAEHLGYTANFAIPLLGTWAYGRASIAMFYVYLLGFDVLNAIGHCNFEFFPRWAFRAFPPLKYLIYTPTFHSLHHSHVHTNFCLFMPLYDHIYGTVDADSDALYERSSGGKREVPAPDMVFLGHGTELLSVFHLPWMFPRFASKPYDATSRPSLAFLWLLWPLAALSVLPLNLLRRALRADGYAVAGRRVETWFVPRYGFQYFFRSSRSAINAIIERAVLKADRAGVKVIGLGALNKAEYINGGGKQFVDTLGDDIAVRIVHGNTLTAACILHELAETHSLFNFPEKTTNLTSTSTSTSSSSSPSGQVFLTGATSKLGRAVAIYLASRGVEVLLQTASEDRFRQVVDACPPDARGFLRRVDGCEAGASCPIWVMGRPCTDAEQAYAPTGTVFHQYVVPPVREVRADCVYGKLATMRLPVGTKGLRTCEMTCERGTVHACHAGALVHALEGWTHHEVGHIDCARIDLTWNAALKHGVLPVPSGLVNLSLGGAFTCPRKSSVLEEPVEA